LGRKAVSKLELFAEQLIDLGDDVVSDGLRSEIDAVALAAVRGIVVEKVFVEV